MTPDLYSTLGVPKDADKATIRRAYRRKAKAAHPDGGGDKEKFGALTKAHDVLTNDERRARYDATGDASEKEVDNAHAEALMLIGAMLEATIGECAQHNIDPVTADLAAALRRRADLELADIEKARIAAEKNKVAAEKLLKRFTQKRKGEPNLLEMICANRVKPHVARLAELAKAHDRMTRARKVLDDYAFEADERPNPQSVRTFFFNAGIGATTA